MRHLAEGRSSAEVARLTGVPVNTVRTWVRRPVSVARRLAGCPDCGGDHARRTPPSETYAYLLGVYLGDGHIAQAGRSQRLRITLDVGYPGIVRSVCDAVEEVCGRRPAVRADPRGQRCLNVDSVWRSWPCLLPQHGPGRKHDRPIELVPWQEPIIRDHAGPFLRGLIHTDGWRGLNRVTAKGRTYAYPRYQFSNRSDDIRRLFCDACDREGIAWRPWGRFEISVAQRASVARMDVFIGPKT